MNKLISNAKRLILLILLGASLAACAGPVPLQSLGRVDKLQQVS